MAAPATGVNDQWYQNADFVFASFFKKNLREVDVQFQPQKVLISQDSEKLLELNLEGRICPSECSFSIHPTKIDLKLKKSPGSCLWKDLEVSSQPSHERSPKHPSFSENAKKCEDAVKKLKEQKKNTKPEKEQDIRSLFKTIFQNASPDTRKAMNKSFLESAGTSLSTNWDEVSKKKVEIQPPEGVEFKKF